MFAGVPAMGLGYEDKTEEIFRQMGLESYQIPFTSDVRNWIERTGHFMANNVSGIRDQLGKALDERCAAAEANITAIEQQLGKTATAADTTGLTTEQRWSHSVKRYGRPHLRLRQVAALVNQLEPQRMLEVGCATGHLRILCPGASIRGATSLRQRHRSALSFTNAILIESLCRVVWVTLISLFARVFSNTSKMRLHS